MIFGQPPDTASMNFEGSRSMVWTIESLTAGPLFQFHRAERCAFGLEFGLVLVLLTDHQSPLRLGLDDLAGVEDLTAAGYQLARGS
jgi:hypothetical protein